jgi:thiosulfate/3-mercaptopyruvate sulfurtransferase
VARTWPSNSAACAGKPTPRRFRGSGLPPVFCNAEFVLDASRFAGFMVVDARSAERFRGTAPEPRVGLRSGHIPDSLNLPFEAVLEYGRMRPYAVLRRLFEDTGVTSKNLIFSCGSGVTACIPALAAEILGISDIRIYDGSWAEWGGREDLPIASS